LNYSWVYIVAFELLASVNSPIEVNNSGGYLTIALLAKNIREAIDNAEAKALKDGYVIAFIQSADRFDAEHFDRDIHNLTFESVERLEPQKNEIEWISTIVYD